MSRLKRVAISDIFYELLLSLQVFKGSMASFTWLGSLNSCGDDEKEEKQNCTELAKQGK